MSIAKLLGGASRSIAGGVLGSLLASTLIHWRDKGRRKGIRHSHYGSTRQGSGDVEAAFFNATFSVMGHLAKADGRVSEKEIEQARQVMDHMGLAPQLRQLAMELFSAGKQSDFDMAQALGDLMRVSARRHDVPRHFMEIQLRIAYADGHFHPNARRILLTIARRLGFTALEFGRLEAVARTRGGARDKSGSGGKPKTLHEAFAALHIKPNSSDVEVKMAYRRLMAQHHPDKMVARGGSQEDMRLAGQKTFEVRSAYEQIRKVRGF